MKEIHKQVEEILTLKENKVYQQITDFDKTLKDLQKIYKIEKPVYDLPQVDTIGKYTFNKLHKI